jgi:mannose-6-phosphate isomerase-like protein (cupin superfamily)
MRKTNLHESAAALQKAWHSVVIGRAAGANLKVLRMDGNAYPNEVHDFDEALLVLDGQMNLDLGGRIMPVRAGEICIVPAGHPHAIAPGSQGTLVIVDR